MIRAGRGAHGAIEPSRRLLQMLKGHLGLVAQQGHQGCGRLLPGPDRSIPLLSMPIPVAQRQPRREHLGQLQIGQLLTGFGFQGIGNWLMGKKGRFHRLFDRPVEAKGQEVTKYCLQCGDLSRKNQI